MESRHYSAVWPGFRSVWRQRFWRYSLGWWFGSLISRRQWKTGRYGIHYWLRRADDGKKSLRSNDS